MNKYVTDKHLIYITAFLRSIGIGMIAVILAIYLMKEGLTKTQIGLVVSMGLIGAAVGTLIVTFFGDLIGRRKVLILYSIFSAAGALAVCLSTSFYAILAAAFFGMMNARGKDRGPALVIESSIIPSTESDQKRTLAFAWYYMVQDIGLALGGLAASLPTLLSAYGHLTESSSFQLTFGAYAVCMLLAATVYSILSKNSELSKKTPPFKLSPEGKKMATRLSAMFAIDGLAGGFLTSSLVAFYFYERFNVSIEQLGLLFFAAHCLNALSHLGSAWLAKKAGLVNTMVFTHSFAHLLLIAVAFAPTFPLAVCFYLLRETFSKMEGPTKRSYITAMVLPEERTKINGISQMVRTMGWAVAPAFAGFVMQEISIGTPLLIGAGMKLAYDMSLYIAFHNSKPPEELEQQRPIRIEPHLVFQSL